jgi:hypothetical protein
METRTHYLLWIDRFELNWLEISIHYEATHLEQIANQHTEKGEHDIRSGSESTFLDQMGSKADPLKFLIFFFFFFLFRSVDRFSLGSLSSLIWLCTKVRCRLLPSQRLTIIFTTIYYTYWQYLRPCI